MTRKDLLSLGFSDTQLKDEVRTLFAVDLALADNDAPATQNLREHWFREVSSRTLRPATVMNVKTPMQSWAQENPDAHAEFDVSEGKP